LDSSLYTTEFDKNSWRVKIDGRTITFGEGTKASSKMQAVLNKVSPGATNGKFAKCDGKFYGYKSGKWYLINSKLFEETYDALYAGQNRTSSGTASGMNRTENLAGSGFQQR
jgi:hypothetical protein